MPQSSIKMGLSGHPLLLLLTANVCRRVMVSWMYHLTSLTSFMCTLSDLHISVTSPIGLGTKFSWYNIINLLSEIKTHLAHSLVMYWNQYEQTCDVFSFPGFIDTEKSVETFIPSRRSMIWSEISNLFHYSVLLIASIRRYNQVMELYKWDIKYVTEL